MSYAASMLAFAHDDGEHWWFLFPFFWLLWLGLIATVLYFVFGRRSRRCGGTDRARAILAERFARGEISGEELRDRLAQLP